MSKVRLEFLSPLAEALGTEKKSDGVPVEAKIEEDKTVQYLLSQLAIQHPRFEQIIFDVKAQRLIETVSIFLNGNHLELADGLRTRLNDGDILTFISLIEGG